jgi:sarcosine oxidase subunit gamma
MVDLRIDMPEPHGRGLVRLRVPLDQAAQAAAVARLPLEPLTVDEGEPAVLWVGPDQWLIVSGSRPAEAVLDDLAARLEGILYHASDASDALALLTVEGRGARGLLAMLSGIDYDPASFPPGRCARTRMAKVAVLVRALDTHRFELFVDRSVAHYLEGWLRHAARDPILCS